jgi:ATP-dependent DNA helicase RecG
LVDRASDLARYLLHRDPYLESEQGLAARRCLILFERDDAMRLLQAG